MLILASLQSRSLSFELERGFFPVKCITTLLYITEKILEESVVSLHRKTTIELYCGSRSFRRLVFFSQWWCVYDLSSHNDNISWSKNALINAIALLATFFIILLSLWVSIESFSWLELFFFSYDSIFTFDFFYLHTKNHRSK